MIEDADSDQKLTVDYYIVEGHGIAKVNYDSETGEDMGGEILVANGTWQEYPTSAILGEGELVSRSEAKKHAKKRGLRL